MKINLLMCLVLLVCSRGLTQESESHETHHSMKGSHRLTIGLGHTNTSQGEVDGETAWLVLPSWSVTYDYWFSNRWAVGLQTDWVVENFVVEEEDGKELERSKPLSVVPVVLFKPGDHVAFFFGVGEEFTKEKNLTMTRLGAEYGWHLPKNWEVGIDAYWDNKWGYYNSWGLAFTASKIFAPAHY